MCSHLHGASSCSSSHGPLHLWKFESRQKTRTCKLVHGIRYYWERSKVFPSETTNRRSRFAILANKRLLCFRHTLIWWKPGAGRALPSSTRITKGWCGCRSSWRHTDPMNSLLRSDSWARVPNTGEFPDFSRFRRKKLKKQRSIKEMLCLLDKCSTFPLLQIFWSWKW